MKPLQLGHVVLMVRSCDESEAFYTGVLGIPVASRLTEPMRMTFFTLGNHHDFATMEVAPDAPPAAPGSTGLAHVAFKVGDSLDELRAVKEEVEAAGVTVQWALNHFVTQSIYLRDPDGNEVELYVDGSDGWKTNPDLVKEFAELQI
jgi:catechol 2,3-dioxygenase